ncbi:hypothetical protein B9K06_02120 [Bacillus sp. OG2]|nr:hypothetical protein B9K06_02120 [Bacillus sp. OG2]
MPHRANGFFFGQEVIDFQLLDRTEFPFCIQQLCFSLVKRFLPSSRSGCPIREISWKIACNALLLWYNAGNMLYFVVENCHIVIIKEN